MLELSPDLSARRSAGRRCRPRVADLRAAFRASAVRPVALSTGSRLLVRLVDELEWLSTTVANACADAPESWPPEGRRLRAAAGRGAAVVRARAGPRRRSADQEQLREARRADLGARPRPASRSPRRRSTELRHASATGATAGLGTLVADAGDVAGGEFDRPLYAAHELGYVVALTARTVAVIVAAERRTCPARLLGRRPINANLGDEFGVNLSEAAAAERLAAGHFDRHSVWFQNSIRGAAGLAVAVLLARITGPAGGLLDRPRRAVGAPQSNALTTAATRAAGAGGTAVGFLIGGLLVAGIGTSTAVLWPLLPIAIFVAAFAPELISFAAGQAAFTVVGDHPVQHHRAERLADRHCSGSRTSRSAAWPACSPACCSGHAAPVPRSGGCSARRTRRARPPAAVRRLSDRPPGRPNRTCAPVARRLDGPGRRRAPAVSGRAGCASTCRWRASPRSPTAPPGCA